MDMATAEAYDLAATGCDLLDLRCSVGWLFSKGIMKIRNSFASWCLAFAVVVLSKLLFCTLRVRLVAASPFTNPYLKDTTESYIYCVWHDSVAFPMFAGRHVRTVALVSKHQDGSCLSSGLQMLRIGLVRGSSNRHGAPAMREMLRLPDGKHVVMTPDGPRGPRRQLKPGLVFLASRTGPALCPRHLRPAAHGRCEEAGRIW